MSSPPRVLMALLLGALVGYACEHGPFHFLQHVPGLIEPLARLFLNAILVCVIPLVSTSLIAGCAATSIARLGRLAGKMSIVMFLYLAAAAVFSGVISFALVRYLSHIFSRGLTIAGSSPPVAAVPTLGSFLTGMVPANIFKAAQEGALLPLMIASVAMGIAIAHLPDSQRALLTNFFRALADAFTVLLNGILKAVPLGVFCLSVGLGATIAVGGANWLLGYVAAMCFITAAFIPAVLYPSVAIFSPWRVSEFIKAITPAQAIAFTSRSSLAALPASYKLGKEVFHLPEDVCAFFFPLAASMFHAGGCIVQVVGVSFLAGFYGVSLSFALMTIFVLNAIAVSLTAPGIPGGAILVMSPMLAAAGIPLEGMAMLLAVDTLPDMFRTTTTISSWLGAASILSTGPRSAESKDAAAVLAARELDG